MWLKSLITMTFLLCANVVFAAEIVKWVDADGVTHFGNPQFAPEAQSEEVSVHRVNGMEVPDTSGLREVRRSGRQVVTLKKAPKKNKRGWRGHRSQRTTNQGYRG